MVNPNTQLALHKILLGACIRAHFHSLLARARAHVVSEVFGRANTFTITDVDDNEIEDVKVLQNPAVSYKHGAGPILVKMLVDSGVNVVTSAELGPGASALLEQHNITRVTAKPGNSVSETIRNALVEIGK